MKTLPKGFKDSDIGPIPQDWEVKAIGTRGELVRGVGFKPDDLNEGLAADYYMLLRANNVQDENISYDDVLYVHKCRVLREQILKKGDILICMSNGSRHLVGKSALLTELPPCVCTFGAFMAILRFRDNEDVHYMSHVLHSRLFYNNIQVFLAGSAINNLVPNQIEEMLIAWPSHGERLSISEVLSDMDALISAQDELLAKKRAIKQGAMQELLTGRRRLSGFPVRPMKQTDIGPIPEDWEVRQIGSAAISVTPPKKLETSDYRASGCYRVIDQGQEQCAGYSDDAKAVLQHPPYILFGDHTCIVKYTDFPFIQGADGLKILKANGGVFPRYLYYAFFNCTIPGQGYNRHWSIAKELQIPIPALPEQRAIAEVLCAMDMEIEELEEGLEKQRALKRGMMQELLSGRIRLPYKELNP